MNSVNIFLVEDNEGDILLMSDALADAKFKCNITVVKDGESAIDYLNKRGKFSLASTPDLVLLDIDLPKINGHQLLSYIKNHQKLKEIPVIILTTSSNADDIKQCYENHADSYLIKPVEVEGFNHMIGKIEKFWSKKAGLS